MTLSMNDKQLFKNYVSNSLVERFNYSEQEATNMVKNSSIIEELEKDPVKVMHFDSEFWASKISAKSKVKFI